MGYVNIFQKLDQDIANKLQKLQVEQQQLLEKKKSLLGTKLEIQKFLNSAEDVKKLVDSEPELLKSLRLELGKIFSLQTPKLPVKISENNTPNLEQNFEEESSQTPTPGISIKLEEESINDFNFVDAQGKNTPVKK